MRAYHHRYTWLDYLRLERDSNVKHEFVEGEILAMGGGTPQHSALASRIIQSLGALVSHREALMEIHRRTNGHWERLEARMHGVAHLESIGCSLDVDEIYAGIELHRSG